ncbi:hypothetical protein RF11_01035 [Thelohanellus kitauei]|uniref:Uncharacterized protein n=1 Tax=Thelohanellus kitauei TaxID=669202 RepID=A0A0C2IBD8_THEKT|nr:hypothetical protein RF11_01035 [Thelohanellus kitauei]
MDVVIRFVNKIPSNALNRREFWQFLSEKNEKYNELLLHHELKEKLFKNLCDDVYAFKMKLRGFIRQVTEGISDAFSTLKPCLQEKTFYVLQHQINLENLLETF